MTCNNACEGCSCEKSLDDLVWRLRAYGRETSCPVPKLQEQAADEIDRLQSRVEELESGIDAAIQINNEHQTREDGYLARIAELEASRIDIVRKTLECAAIEMWSVPMWTDCSIMIKDAQAAIRSIDPAGALKGMK